MITVNTITEKLSAPEFNVPKLDLSKIDVSRATNVARDVALIGVGAVVVSVEAVDERSRAFAEQITAQFRKVTGATG